MNPTSEQRYVVKPEYFLHDILVFNSAKELEDFLNYSRYTCDVRTMHITQGASNAAIAATPPVEKEAEQ